MASHTVSSSRRNHRASLALLTAVCGVLAVPAAVALSRESAGIVLLDAAYAIPVGMVLSLAALFFVRGGRGRIRQTLERAGGRHRLRASTWIAGAGVCVALSASIAVGFYELLLRLEN